MGRHASVRVVFGVKIPEGYELPFDPYDAEKWWLAKFVTPAELEDMGYEVKATLLKQHPCPVDTVGYIDEDSSVKLLVFSDSNWEKSVELQISFDYEAVPLKELVDRVSKIDTTPFREFLAKEFPDLGEPRWLVHPHYS